MERKVCRGILAMVLSLIMVITVLPCNTDVQAKTWTKAEVNKKITTLNKQIKKYQKKDKAAKKGKTAFFGKIISYDLVEAGGTYAYCTVVAVNGRTTDTYENTFCFNEKEYYAGIGQEIILKYFMNVEGNGVKYLNYDSTSLEHDWIEDDVGYEDLCFVASAPGDYQVSITDWFGCTDTCIIHVQ